MRSLLRATAIALALPVVSGVVQAQAPAKIAYVNSQTLLDVAPGRASADSALNKMGEGFKTQLTKLQDSARKVLTDYQKNEPKLTAAQKEKAQKDLEALDNELQTKQQQFQQQFAARQQELMSPITDAVKQVIDDIRVEGGYAVIFDNAPGASNIVAADKNLDITDKVVSRLKATPAPKIKAEAAGKGAPSAPAGVTKPPIKPPTQ
jgi:outer membrane protein